MPKQTEIQNAPDPRQPRPNLRVMQSPKQSQQPEQSQNRSWPPAKPRPVAQDWLQLVAELEAVVKEEKECILESLKLWPTIEPGPLCVQVVETRRGGKILRRVQVRYSGARPALGECRPLEASSTN